MTITPEKINSLCEQWCLSVKTPDGGMAIGGNSEKFRLFANGVKFHELDHLSLMASILGLSKVLLLPGLNTIIVQDHFGLWSWCAEIIVGSRSEYFSHEDHEIKSLFQASIRASLANCKKPAGSSEEHQLQYEAEQKLPHHARYFLSDSSLVLAYISFPLLESTLKRVSSKCLNMDGTVKSDFQVQNRAGKPRHYKTGTQCSSIRDALNLVYDQVADSELKVLLDQFRVHISSLDGSQDPFDLIYSWRNQSLHGSTNFQTIGGTLLNLSLLLCVYSLKDNYEELRDKVVEHCKWEEKHDHKSPWSFYPPY
ncbi:hypothetical protein [Shewanella sp. ALD9]|uniref:hypothetical protein n=1 Tax=Shewanella sp. ALD9 TaxID=2058330 RepID=UPI000C34FDBF|nr:hypothetical protein [Shewanella sp. ALD9]PKH34543.1 hypothetical protein CXF88_01710 [Shewanella sp. ALD9]